jgi:hypothetical protein
MDEMRQIVRILIKIIPQSEVYFHARDQDDSGGNKVTEKEIRTFLSTSLGEAPQPVWSLPDGWGQYIAGAHPGLQATQQLSLCRFCCPFKNSTPWLRALTCTQL